MFFLLALLVTVMAAVIGANALRHVGGLALLAWAVGYPLAVFAIAMLWAATRSRAGDDSCAGAVSFCYDDSRGVWVVLAIALAVVAFLVAAVSAAVCAVATWVGSKKAPREDWEW
jgi:hypothetical protein